MLSSRFAQASRIVASCSAKPWRNLHATAAAPAAKPQGTVRTQKRNGERKELLDIVNPLVVLGHHPDDQAKWLDCDLAKILVTPDKIKAAPIPPMTPTDAGSNSGPSEYLNFGIGEKEKSMLFEVLPAMSTERSLEIMQPTAQTVQPSFVGAEQPNVEFIEEYKTNMFARLVDLRNANARGIAFENRRRCIATFSEPGKPNDSGRTEVQAALLTMQIRDLWGHLTRNRKDHSNRRSLRMLVHKRAKMLRYLKGVDEDRYDRVLERLGLNRESVEGELNV